ncbi:glycosaminoglycan xylosylkinase homolog [Chironomus tepperi]|uniref:glycosaminoglycan xylosylkinase homolog n=1 Tax=Chironomus tepperi TaxID=113505 RepID=UPI00391FC782
MKKYCCATFIFLISLVFIIYSVNFYFLSRLSHDNNKLKSKLYINENFEYNDVEDEKINHENVKLKPIYRNRNPKYPSLRDKLINNYKPCNRSLNYSQIWETVDSWSKETANEIYPAYSSRMCQVLSALREVKILSAQNYRKGTQLKLNITVEGGKTIVFKPAWYTRNQVIEGEVYAGKDRHNSEILAFYLGAVLNFRSTGLVVGRSINIRDVFQLADKELRETIISKGNGTKFCVYGKCFYCKPSESVCGNKTHYMEGAFLYEISGPLQKHKSPWQRTYKDGAKAVWEIESDNNNYCDNVKQKLSLVRLLDLIDASIFDFLIQNGDRHHYETRKNRMILLDNGKGFANFRTDFTDILAPLYQCCLIRKTTYTRLLVFTGGALTEILKELTKNDLLHPILNEKHYYALERRLLKIFSMIEFCRSKNENSIFQ